jgi:DNA-binding NtrC family response regulator
MTVTYAFRALVVDDDVLVRHATSRALTNEGFLCDVAADGAQAMEKLHHRTFDVAIADLRMPVMNGHKLVVEMLEMDPRPAIIVLTGVPDPRLIRDLFARGVEDVMAKPANYDVLVLKAKALAERRRLLKQEAATQIEPKMESASENLSTAAPSKLNSMPEDESALCDGKNGAVQVTEAQDSPPNSDPLQSANSNTFSIEELAAAIRPAIEAEHAQAPKHRRRRGRKMW